MTDHPLVYALRASVACRATLVLSATCALFAVTDTATACINGVTHTIDPTTFYVASAERMLEASQPDNAARQVLTTLPDLKQAVPGRSKVKDRALIVLATALVRLDGDFAGAPFRAKSKQARAANLSWATSTLQALSSKRRADATLDSTLAEAWSKDPRTEELARDWLIALETRDRVATSYGYAALARLRRNKAAGSPGWLSAPLRTLGEGLAMLAEARCRKMSKEASHCGEPARG